MGRGGLNCGWGGLNCGWGGLNCGWGSDEPWVGGVMNCW